MTLTAPVLTHAHFRLFQRLTAETIASCAFGLETNSVKDPDCVFLRKVRNFFREAEAPNVTEMILATVVCEYLRSLSISEACVPGKLEYLGSLSTWEA